MRLVIPAAAWLLFLLSARPACAQRDSVAASIPRISGLSAALLAGERAVNEPHKLLIYLNEEGRRVPTAEQAFRHIEVSFRDSASGSVRVYYPSGKLFKITPYAHLRLGVRHGVESTWSEEGKMRTQQEYYGGKQQGEFYAYYPDGTTVARHLHFESNMLQSIECFGRDGKPKNCAVAEVLPQYRGGWAALAGDLERNFVYPADDLRAGRGGTLRLLIQVDAAGKVQGVGVHNAPSETLREAMLAAASKLTDFRQPGTQDKVPVPVKVLLAVELAVKKSGKGTARVSDFPMGVFPAYWP
jgi:hypothetical protein